MNLHVSSTTHDNCIPTYVLKISIRLNSLQICKTLNKLWKLIPMLQYGADIRLIIIWVYFLHETCYWLWIITTLHIIIHAYAFFMNKRRIAVEKFWKRKKKNKVGHGTRTINVFELYLLEDFKIIPKDKFSVSCIWW